MVTFQIPQLFLSFNFTYAIALWTCKSNDLLLTHLPAQKGSGDRIYESATGYEITNGIGKIFVNLGLKITVSPKRA